MMKGLLREAVAASVSAGDGDGRRRSDGARGWWRCVLTSERLRLPAAPRRAGSIKSLSRFARSWRGHVGRVHRIGYIAPATSYPPHIASTPYRAAATGPRLTRCERLICRVEACLDSFTENRSERRLNAKRSICRNGGS